MTRTNHRSAPVLPQAFWFGKQARALSLSRWESDGTIWESNGTIWEKDGKIGKTWESDGKHMGTYGT